ncbi:hypothetical protein CDAR_423361 [Caerostris darwini]|uniref:Uncharacterized protein n=1 Tax=Caerostris darwini TaxID=1538125 RepID=A0AAV4TL89_9ARAC|nr:hypothetical protein CDAR_423361 [Caerostris darwini]
MALPSTTPPFESIAIIWASTYHYCNTRRGCKKGRGGPRKIETHLTYTNPGNRETTACALPRSPPLMHRPSSPTPIPISLEKQVMSILFCFGAHNGRTREAHLLAKCVSVL